MRAKDNGFPGALLAAVIASLPASAVAASDVAKVAARPAANAPVDFAISVPRVMQMRLLSHPASIDVTADDIARGSIRVTGPRVDLLVNDASGYVIRAELAAGAFAAVKIIGLASPFVATPAGALVAMPSMVGRPKPAPTPVEYELHLAADAQPGHYAWPVTLSLQQL